MASKKRPTQADVANLSGVSRATVSYVLNGKAGGQVAISPATRERVIQAAKELKYEPDVRARALRSGRVDTIGLLIPDLTNPHFWQIIQGALRAARAAGYDLVLTSSNLDPDQEKSALRAIAQRRVDGLILLPAFTTPSQDLFAVLQKRSVPITMIGLREEFDSIGADYHAGAETALGHLLELGHQRIAFVHGVANPVMGQGRVQAYIDGLRAADIPYDEALVVRCGAQVQDGYRAAQQLFTMANPPTAIMVINDFLAQGVIRAALDLGLRVPEDCSVLGFDNIPAADFMVPRLTTLETNAAEIGAGAVDLLFQRLADPSLPPRTRRLSCELIVRESTVQAPHR